MDGEIVSLKTLDNALNILKLFINKSSWGVRELAKEMGVSHSIIHRIVSTFEKHGFLERNLETNKYELGLKFLEYGFVIQNRVKLSDMIYPVMKELSEDTGESTVLTLLDGLEGIYFQIVESSKNVKFAETLGKRAPLYIGASHKIIMAYLPREDQEAIINQGLEARTDKTITDPEALLRDLKEIKEKAWCYSWGEYLEDVAALSVPLFNTRNQVIASLTIAGPRYRFPQERAFELLKLLQESGRKVQESMNLANYNWGS